MANKYLEKIAEKQKNESSLLGSTVKGSLVGAGSVGAMVAHSTNERFNRYVREDVRHARSHNRDIVNSKKYVSKLTNKLVHTDPSYSQMVDIRNRRRDELRRIHTKKMMRGRWMQGARHYRRIAPRAILRETGLGILVGSIGGGLGGAGLHLARNRGKNRGE